MLGFCFPAIIDSLPQTFFTDLNISYVNISIFVLTLPNSSFSQLHIESGIYYELPV